MTTSEFVGHRRKTLEFQHVLRIFRDIRSYNKKILGNSSVFQQEVVLPDNFMLHTISSKVPDFESDV